jgi:quinol-cytochrome oxidoreductase complex cytochrome b subunit
LILVQRLGMSVPPSEERNPEPRRPMRFVPDFLLHDLFAWTVALGVLAALASLFPWELGEKADPFAPAFANIRPEWYFMFMFQSLRFVPGGRTLGLENEVWPIMGFGLLGLLVLLVPWLDRGIVHRGRSPVFTLVGTVMVTAFVVLTAIGYHAWWPVGAGIVLLVLPILAGRAMIRANKKDHL